PGRACLSRARRTLARSAKYPTLQPDRRGASARIRFSGLVLWPSMPLSRRGGSSRECCDNRSFVVRVELDHDFQVAVRRTGYAKSIIALTPVQAFVLMNRVRGFERLLYEGFLPIHLGMSHQD